MRPVEPFILAGWPARLELGYERRGDATVAAHRSHVGPLRVQKPLYPEGRQICHTVVLHPPGGLCGGDDLAIDIRAGQGAQVLLTTPGATKWYRCPGSGARQRVELRAEQRASLEWLPQESIVFDNALASMETEIELAEGAGFVGWEIACLGRRASGERFERGALRLRTRVKRAGRVLWLEQGRIEGGGAVMRSPAGLAGASVFGTLLAVGAGLDGEVLERCRSISPKAGRGAATRLPDVLVARYLGDETEAAREYFAAVWAELRPAVVGREAIRPRIWNT